MALNPGQAFRLGAGEDFPIATYGAIGSSLARSGHLVELGWNGAQASAFLEGMRAAFLGQALPPRRQGPAAAFRDGPPGGGPRCTQPGPVQARAFAAGSGLSPGLVQCDRLVPGHDRTFRGARMERGADERISGGHALRASGQGAPVWRRERPAPPLGHRPADHRHPESKKARRPQFAG